MLKNITLSADLSLIEKARRRAAGERKSLNDLFRQWISRYVGGQDKAQAHRRLLTRLTHVRAGRSFTRDEMNER
jgi:hypothetical protein